MSIPPHLMGSHGYKVFRYSISARLSPSPSPVPFMAGIRVAGEPGIELERTEDRALPLEAEALGVDSQLPTKKVAGRGGAGLSSSAMSGTEPLCRYGASPRCR